jgi:N-acyl-phosphatidylethanolamine-hydrolysing phospholipase D
MIVGKRSRLKRRIAIALLGLLGISSCAVVNPYFDATKKHHTASGFVNNYGVAGGKPLSELLRWQYEAFQNNDPKPPSIVYKGYAEFPILKPDLAALKANCANPDTSKPARCNAVSVTWIGHSTVLVQMGGLNILTDPHFSERTAPVQFAGPKRRVALPTTLAELPRIDLVVISHNHYDHLDTNTVKALQSQTGGPPIFAAPLGIDLWLKEQGVTRVERFDWWDSKKLLGVDVHFVPAQHWSSRSPFDRNATLWGGWVIKEVASAADSGKSMFFAGDTGYSKDFLDIGARFGQFDIALIPVGAYQPRWFMKDQHVDPEEAVRIHQDVKAKWSMGVHWGTFELTDEALDQPIVDLAKALDQLKVSKEDFVLFKHGQTRFFR